MLAAALLTGMKLVLFDAFDPVETPSPSRRTARLCWAARRPSSSPSWRRRRSMVTNRSTPICGAASEGCANHRRARSPSATNAFGRRRGQCVGLDRISGRHLSGAERSGGAAGSHRRQTGARRCGTGRRRSWTAGVAWHGGGVAAQGAAVLPRLRRRNSGCPRVRRRRMVSHRRSVGIDDDGNVVVTGRIKDAIIRNAENISALEVEGVLASHPAVADVAVIGVPDERTGERVCAVVVARPGVAVTLSSVRTLSSAGTEQAQNARTTRNRGCAAPE